MSSSRSQAKDHTLKFLSYSHQAYDSKLKFSRSMIQANDPKLSVSYVRAMCMLCACYVRAMCVLMIQAKVLQVNAPT